MATDGTTPGKPASLRIRAFEPADADAFRRLNEEWIAWHFGMEERDRLVLGDPVGRVLSSGGRIFFAVSGDETIGCCALLALEPGVFEVAKMAVSESRRGNGVGRKLLEHAIAEARALGARRLYLETNRKLHNAIHLYESAGFRHLPPERVKPSPYARADVFMEMLL